MKRLLSAMLALVLLTGLLPAANAASDIENHWAKTYLTELHTLGVINPSGDGLYTPDAKIARWEFMRYINRAFGFTETDPISFSDVAIGSTYYETVQIAVHYGYINGVGNNKMDPTGTLTREQAATILGRLHKYVPSNDSTNLKFTDSGDISSYAVPYVAEAVRKGYIDGYNDGSFRPKNNISRAEIAKILYYFLGNSLQTQNQIYTQASLNSKLENVSISKPCTLSGADITGNLFITEGVGTGNVVLENVSIKGNLIISGGSVTLTGVSAMNLIVDNPCGVAPQVTASGNTSIANTEVHSNAALTESGLSVSAGGFADLTLNGEGLNLTLDASVWEMNIKQPATVLTTGSTTISDLNADAAVSISGGGTISKAILNTSGSSLSMMPASLVLSSGVTATIAGQYMSSSDNITVSPGALTFDISLPSSIAHSYDFTFNADQNDLIRVSLGNQVLAVGTDYNLLTGGQNGIRLYKTFLTTLAAGTYDLKLTFADNSTASIMLLATDSSMSAVSPSQAVYDLNETSPNHANLSFTILFPSGVSLNSAKMGSITLQAGTDYTYNSSTHVLTLFSDVLSKKSRGTYTISFVPTKGNTISSTISVVDSTPVNTVAPEAVDFDANTASTGYTDLSVTLTTVDGATLRYIRADGRNLEENWQYKVSGNQVTLSRSALGELAKENDEYTVLTFVMSSGVNPTLRVNFVTTYALTINVRDDLGGTIEGAQVSITPNDAQTGSAAQTLTTDENGRAIFYVKRGTYNISVTHDRFTKTLSDTVSVSAARSLILTGEILEDVQIIVTNSYGSYLAGAVVTIGGQSVTTGADGVARFSLRRSAYPVQVACTGYQTQTLAISVSGPLQERVTLN